MSKEEYARAKADKYDSDHPTDLTRPGACPKCQNLADAGAFHGLSQKQIDDVYIISGHGTGLAPTNTTGSAKLDALIASFECRWYIGKHGAVDSNAQERILRAKAAIQAHTARQVEAAVAKARETEWTAIESELYTDAGVMDADDVEAYIKQRRKGFSPDTEQGEVKHG